MSLSLRKKRAMAAARAAGVDALLVTHLPDVRYLCGFTGSNAALVLAGNRAVLFTDGRYTAQDRKSTRLKSSHPSISYAVFCLKKKTNGDQPLLRYGLGVGLDGHRWRPFDRGSTRRLE